MGRILVVEDEPEISETLTGDERTRITELGEAERPQGVRTNTPLVIGIAPGSRETSTRQAP